MGDASVDVYDGVDVEGVDANVNVNVDVNAAADIVDAVS